jgi:hypothetical protein
VKLFWYVREILKSLLVLSCTTGIFILGDVDLIKIIQKYSGTLHEGISMFYGVNSDTQGVFFF